MLDQFVYENHLGQRFDGLSNGVYLDTSELRNYTWSYQTINSRISRFYRKTTNRKIPLYVVGQTDAQAIEAMNRLFDVTEADIATHIPGKVFVGEYYTTGFVTVSKKTEYLQSKQLCKLEITLTSDDPAWYRDEVHSFYTDATVPKAAASGAVITVSDVPASAVRGFTLYGRTTQDGTPTPDAPVALESVGADGNVTVSIGTSSEDQTAQTAVIDTPDGLHGLSFSTSAIVPTYTDANNVKWYADTIEYDADTGRNILAKRVACVVLDGSDDEMWSLRSGTYPIFELYTAGLNRNIAGKCTHYKNTAIATSVTNTGFSTTSANNIIRFRPDDYASLTLDEWKARLAAEPITITYALATAEETELTDENVSVISAMRMKNPNTTIYNEDGAYMEVVYSTIANTSGSAVGGFDYPYEYNLEYGVQTGGRNITNGTYTGNAFRILIYGAVINPTVIIGGHAYTVNGAVGEGETLTIDSMTKTITLTTASGAKINYFDKRDRQNYIFQPIQPGQNAVTWSGDFGFELTVIEERSEPKWT